MRFAYIDSHGNEVPIPSVDALALRIELGAIGPDTELYDAQADHWGPAKTHEIFHTLSRDTEEEGFVAPPPPVAAAPVPPPPAEEAAPEPEPAGSADASGEPDLGLTLADPPPEPEEPVQEEAAGELDDLDLELAPAPADDGPLLLDDEPAASEPEGAVEGQDGGFDFGDLSGGLEVEQSPAEAAEAPAGDFGGGMEIETSMDFTSAAAGIGGQDDDLQLEQPMSEFQPDAPPGWMEAGASEADDDVMDFSGVSADVPTDEAAPAVTAGTPARQRRSPKDRPSKPRFKRQRSAAPIVLAVLVLALGVGGYVGWPILSARLAERNAPDRPPVVMPVVPEELLPQMRSLAEAAMAAVLDDVSRRTTPAGAPPQPGENWLGGVYLGNASQFAGTESFWVGIGDFMDAVRDAEWRAYREAYVQQAEAAGLDPETAALLTERADSGFVAAAQSRLATYDAMQRAVDAALDLHDFLLSNEENIEYRPASTSTADPVLEAVPSTEAIGDEMWRRVDVVTDALGDVGASYPFTRDRLKIALLERLQQVGFQ